ncbi:MAG: M15 family peptidase [Deltaproteobacteria bacterium]|nr:M15 family peptidase [Deltaproteobacteria bacterium]
MPCFGISSRKKLNTCHIDLQILFERVVQVWDCAVLYGHRGQTEQNEIFQTGASKLRWPKSRHNTQPSIAVDIRPHPHRGWDDTRVFYAFAGFVLGVAEELRRAGRIKHKVRWGGDWDGDRDLTDQDFNDLVHFELEES